jgi:hypothetical protein
MATASHKRTHHTAKKQTGRTMKRTARKTKTASGGRGKAQSSRWSQRVTRESDALDLKSGVFKLHDPRKIAASLKRSAEHSRRRKSGAYRSAMSMLTFYVNRAGKTLPATQKRRLEQAKTELRHLFHRD